MKIFFSVTQEVYDEITLCFDVFATLCYIHIMKLKFDYEVKICLCIIQIKSNYYNNELLILNMYGQRGVLSTNTPVIGIYHIW